MTPDEELHKAVLDAHFLVSENRLGELSKKRGKITERFEKEYRFVLNPTEFPDGAVSGYTLIRRIDDEWKEWITPDPDLLGEHIVLLYDDGSRRWDRRINCLDGNYELFGTEDSGIALWSIFFYRSEFTFAVSDKHLVYSTNAGKVECVERATGRSAWVYSYSRNTGSLWTGDYSFFKPRFSIAHWWSDARLDSIHFYKDNASLLGRVKAGLMDGKMFYDKDSRILDTDLSLKWMLGVSAKGEAPSHPPVTFDPNRPSLDFPEAGRIATLCRILSFTVFVALWLAVSRRVRFRSRVIFLCCILFLNAWAIYSYGRYSETTLLGMTRAFHWACFGLVVNCLRRYYSWAIAPVREHHVKNPEYP